MSLPKRLEITNISASNIQDVGSENSNMQVYAKVSFGKRKIKTMATCSGTNLAWYFSLRFSNIKESEVRKEVSFELYRKRACFKKDEYIGGVKESLLQLLLNQGEENNKRAMRELPFKKDPHGTSTGTLSFSYKIENQPDQGIWRKILIGACANVIGSALSCDGGD